MEPNKPSTLQNKSPCTDLYFLIPHHTQAQEKKRLFLCRLLENLPLMPRSGNGFLEGNGHTSHSLEPEMVYV